MISNSAAHIALRNRARSLVVATTGSMSLAQTTTGFSRASGSFVTDGFVAGMELVPAGFSTIVVGIITDVQALTMAVTGTRAAIAAAGSRSLTVGLPTLRAFENQIFTPDPLRPYVVEEYSPSTSEMVGYPDAGSTIKETGDYFLTWHGLTAAGAITGGFGAAALRQCVDALKLLFAPGTILVAGAHTVRVRRNPAPQTGQIIPLATGAALQLKVPWWALSPNTIAA